MMSAQETSREKHSLHHDDVGYFYDRVYYQATKDGQLPSRHLRRLARRFEPWKGRQVLDVACGAGHWLQAIADCGAVPAGIDISQVALNACKTALPLAELHCGPAEQLPFDEQQFDFVSCLGALEHFLAPEVALREMKRVAKPNARLLLLVPNAEFLSSRLGLYKGTLQSSIKEEARSLPEWQELFESAGLRVQSRWKDLHILSASWIFRGKFYQWPLRAAQALALPFWPLAWQYQVYHLCVVKE
jgi:ubiquinone/menaquinone biosynthesis C-methylase UbiE